MQKNNNISLNLSQIYDTFAKNGVNVSEEQKKFINSCFQECDTINEAGENGADGLLTGKEKASFLAKIYKQFDELYDKLRREGKDDIFNEEKEDGTSVMYRASLHIPGVVYMSTEDSAGNTLEKTTVYADEEAASVEGFIWNNPINIGS